MKPPTHVDSRVTRLLEAGKREAPGVALLDRTLRTVSAQAKLAGARDRKGWWQLAAFGPPVYAAPLLLAALGLAAWLTSGALPELARRKSQLSQPASRLQPERVTAPPLASSSASSIPDPEPPDPLPPKVAKTSSSATAPPTPARRIRQASSAELAARQRQKSAQQQLAEAAARGAAERDGKDECVPQRCSVVRPGDPLIVDFEDVSDEGVFVDGDAFRHKPSDWWLKFYGSTYVYPPSTHAAGLAQTMQHRWHITGLVDAAAGFGLWLGACTVDLSEYRGISFELWGEPGPSGAVTLHVDTDEDSPPENCRSNVGSCAAEQGQCVSPSKRVKVPKEPGRPIVVLWEDIRGGSPRPTPDPQAVIQWHWSFDWQNDSASSPYPVDVWVDDVRLVR